MGEYVKYSDTKVGAWRANVELFEGVISLFVGCLVFSKILQKLGFGVSTLNTEVGWQTDKAADQREKKNLNDVISQANYERLLHSFELEAKRDG